MCRPLTRRLVLSTMVATGFFAISCAGPSHVPTAHPVPATSNSTSDQPPWPPAPVAPLESQPPAHLLVDEPIPSELSGGRVVIRYRADNLRIVPVFGPNALDVSPRIGHIHVRVDDAAWHWADASGEPLIINGLPAGLHKVWIGLADPTHKIIESKTVSFVVPPHATSPAGSPHDPAQHPAPAANSSATDQPPWSPAPVVPLESQPPPHIVVDKPLPDQLTKGLVVIRYRAANLRIVPVFGPNALDVSPRIGHIHVQVDDSAWRWVDASGEPLIIQDLPPGPHKVWIGLADPTHRIIESQTIDFVVPPHDGHH
jgi:hypothetical protein